MQHAYWGAVLIGLALAVGVPQAATAQEAVGHPDLENPGMFERNKEPARATFFPFADRASALSRDPDRSPFVRSLNGTWRAERHLAVQLGQRSGRSAGRLLPDGLR
jgi:hypothetical protein